jgi:hypothetical protein
MIHLLLLDVPITTLGDGNGLIFAPRCDGECFNSRKEKGCDHPVSKVALDNIGEYVLFLSRWYHHGYYNIKSDNVFYTAQLFAMGSSKPEAWQNITRKVNRNMIKGHVSESKLRELTEDLCDNWDITYSVNMFSPSKEFEGVKIDVTKNRHILGANFGSVQRIAELVQLFEDKYKHLTIHSDWLIEKSKENDGFQLLAQGLLAGTQGHTNYCG